MKISKFYYDILGVAPAAGEQEIKKAFRKLVRKNHPDLFPEEKKEIQELKMIQINEAYARLTENINHVWIDENGEDLSGEYKIDGAPVKITPTPEDAVGFHKDIQYAYYKQGFNNFSKAVNGIMSIERTVSLKNDMYYMRRFAKALVYLRKADMYFTKLLNEFPDSIWSSDAYIKIKRIEYFNMIYRKILLNIEKRVKEKVRKRET